MSVSIMIEYINMINIVKNVQGEYVNKLAVSKLIACNDKIFTNNMRKSKSPDYTCFGICNVDFQIV